MSEDGTRKTCPYEMCQDLPGFKRLFKFVKGTQIKMK